MSRFFGVLPFFVLLVFGAFDFPCAHGQLVPNIFGEVVGTLPRSRFMVSAGRTFTPLENRYDSKGNQESFSSLFQKSLDWNQVMSAVPARASQVSGLLSSNGVNLSSPEESAGSFSGNFSGRAETTVPVLGYGITDRVGIYFVLPVIRFQAMSSVAYQASSSAEKLVTELKKSGQNATATDFAASLNDGFSRKLAQSGVNYSDQIDSTYVGDLRVDLPLVMTESRERFQYQIVPTLVFPTATHASLSDLFPFEGGEGRFGMGVRGVGSYRIGRLSFVGSLGGLAMLPRERALRIPDTKQYKEGDLSEDIDSRTQISGGSYYQGWIGSQFQWNTVVKTQLSLQHQGRLSKTYSGRAFESWRYSLLSDSSRERLTSLQASIELNSIPAFLSGGFPMPGILIAGVGLPLEGLKTLSTASMMLQASIFF